MGWLEIFLSPLLQMDVGESLLACLFLRIIWAASRTAASVQLGTVTRVGLCILRGHLTGTAPNALKSTYEDGDSERVLMTMQRPSVEVLCSRD